MTNKTKSKSHTTETELYIANIVAMFYCQWLNLIDRYIEQL